MMFRIYFDRRVFILSACLMILCLQPHKSYSGGIPDAGSYLPKFRLEAPALQADRRYLGTGNKEGFYLSQINAPFILVEIVGVYCPRCHKQAPLFNRLFHRIQRITGLFEKIRMLAIAVGANETEVSYYKKHLRIPYPVIKDPNFEIHKRLGEPRTPFTMLMSKEGKVAFAHLGVIRDMDKFLERIRNIIR